MISQSVDVVKGYKKLDIRDLVTYTGCGALVTIEFAQDGCHC